MKKILVAYDNGAHSIKALETAIELAKGFAAEIYLVSAYSTYDWNQTEMINSIHPELKEFYEQIQTYLEKTLAEAAEKVRQEGITVFTEVWLGAPGEVIIEMAERVQVDLIAIGTHNRGSLGRLFMGSISNYVLHNATCPVLIVKD